MFIQLLTKTNPVGFHHSFHVSLIFLNSFQTHFIKWHCLKTVIFFCDENFTYIVIESTVSFVQRTDLPERWFTYMYFIWIILKRLKYIQKYDFFGDSDWLTYYGSCYSRKKMDCSFPLYRSELPKIEIFWLKQRAYINCKK